jgi:hypothetical protein
MARFAVYSIKIENTCTGIIRFAKIPGEKSTWVLLPKYTLRSKNNLYYCFT